MGSVSLEMTPQPPIHSVPSHHSHSDTTIDNFQQSEKEQDISHPISTSDTLNLPSRTRHKLSDTVRNKIAAAKQDNWKIVCVKATNRQVAQPKQKHIRTILDQINQASLLPNRNATYPSLCYHLHKRMHSTDWLVVIKAQAIFHNLFRSAHANFTAFVSKHQRSAFQITCQPHNIDDDMWAYIIAYGNYLGERLYIQAAHNFPPCPVPQDHHAAAREYMNDFSITEIIKKVPAIMETISVLLQLPMGSRILDCDASRLAFSLTHQDLLLFIALLEHAFVRIHSCINKFEISNALSVLDMWKRCARLVENSRSFFERAKSLKLDADSPALTALSWDRIASVETYLDSRYKMGKGVEFLF